MSFILNLSHSQTLFHYGCWIHIFYFLHTLSNFILSTAVSQDLFNTLMRNKRSVCVCGGGPPDQFTILERQAPIHTAARQIKLSDNQLHQIPKDRTAR